MGSEVLGLQVTDLSYQASFSQPLEQAQHTLLSAPAHSCSPALCLHWHIPASPPTKSHSDPPSKPTGARSWNRASPFSSCRSPPAFAPCRTLFPALEQWSQTSAPLFLAPPSPCQTLCFPEPISSSVKWGPFLKLLC
jgi:hypothetical protein